MNSIRIGLSGASGFIGQKLMQHFLDQGHEVIVISRNKNQFPQHSNLKVIEVDLSRPNPELIAEFTAQLDLLYHLAAELNDPNKMGRTNVAGTRTIVEALEGTKTLFIHLSSIGIFDFSKKAIIREDSPKNAGNPYEKTKLKAEEIILAAQEEKKLKAVLIRPSIVVSNQMKTTLLFQLFNLIQKGVQLKLSKDVIANFVLAEDLIRALVLVGRHPKAVGQAYNFSNDVPLKTVLSLLEAQLKPKIRLRLAVGLLQQILQLLCWLKFISVSQDGIAFFSNHTRVSNEKIQRELGFEFTQQYDGFLQEYVTCHR